MNKYYIAIKNGKIACNWGQGDEEIPAFYAERYSDLREVHSPLAIPGGLPLELFDGDWRIKSVKQLAAEGLDEHGKPLPPEPTAAELEAKAQQ